MFNSSSMSRRQFLNTGAVAVGGATLANPLFGASLSRNKMRVALVGTGVRGVAMYGRDLLRTYGDHVEMVGVCDKNPGRLEYARGFIGTSAPTFTNLSQMLEQTRPETLIVTTWDWEHHECIIEGLQHGVKVIVEKPITIDEEKAQMILDAQARTGGSITVTHNYRYSPHRQTLKQMLMDGAIGDVRAAEFHWHIRRGHMQQYMQRWHGHRERGGSLWVHKSSHHFDLLNWWLDSEPVEVFAMGGLDIFGSANEFRGDKCRTCPHKDHCDYFFDITRDQHLMNMYVRNEHYDGYIRDNCVFRHSINIWDKQTANLKYANGAHVNYSLTADSPYEGFWVAFNGTKGRLEGREGGGPRGDHQEWILTPLRGEQQVVRVPYETGGHWGGDPILMDMLFKHPESPDPLHLRAGTREGIMSALAGVAARKSIDAGAPVKIEGLTSLVPAAKRVRG
jgi:predicted dehydrogenase